ncbi:MAG: hypothetical protein ACTSV2_03575 [Candidatus Thorarchaeota archaeon]
MVLDILRDVLSYGGIVHLSGTAGSGKTLLAASIAATISKSGHVDWVCADGKTSFIAYLKSNIGSVGGNQQDLTVTIAHGYEQVREVVMCTVDRLRDTSRLIVIDPVTRVLDMSHEDLDMWGRELFEDILPTLAGLTISKGVCVLILSEMRHGENGVSPVYHRSIKTWLDLDISLTRIEQDSITKISVLNDGDLEPLHVADMKVSTTGVVEIVGIDTTRGVKDCSEDHCPA